jgi:hypothetical protein
VSSRKGKRSCTPLHFMRSMLLTREPKDFRYCSQEKLVRLSKRSGSRSMVKSQNGEKKARLKLSPECSSLMRPICSTWNASLS